MSHARIAKLATCCLDQWAMDFDGNLRRIVESINVAKDSGARYRVSFKLRFDGRLIFPCTSRSF